MASRWLCALLLIAACDRQGPADTTPPRATRVVPPAKSVPRPAPPLELPEPLPVVEGRVLTEGEIALLAPIFGAGVDPSLIRVAPGKFVRFQDDYTYMTPANTIYAPGDLFRDDFSAADVDPYLQGVFVHEVAHVWQHQNGMDLIAAGLITFAGTSGDYAKAYPYTLDAGRDLTEYGIEQQASIVEDWFLMEVHGLAPGRLENPPATAKARDALYRAVLASFLADPTYARGLGPDELLRRHAAAAKGEAR
jgi:hypothetical protein